VIASPGTFPFPTFVQSGDGGVGKIAIVRVADDHVVRVLAPPCPRSSGLSRRFLRSPNGHLLVQFFDRARPAAPAQWTDLNTGVTYPGYDATVSPDGSRVATQVYGKRRSMIIRQYDAATGHVLSDLVAVHALFGFDWSSDGSALVVAISPGGAKEGGVYVVPRDAHALPDHPDVADPAPYAYLEPAVLANGHVLVFEYQFPDEHNAWSTSVVDIDLQTRAARTVLGDPDYRSSLTPGCDQVPAGTVFPANPGQCRFTDPGSTDADGDNVLFSGQYGGTWLYDGSSVRRITGISSNVAHW
jgi:hypothetical protein